jgi:hypothetical protein
MCVALTVWCPLWKRTRRAKHDVLASLLQNLFFPLNFIDVKLDKLTCVG